MIHIIFKEKDRDGTEQNGTERGKRTIQHKTYTHTHTTAIIDRYERRMQVGVAKMHTGYVCM
jgi:hypothetical protein